VKAMDKIVIDNQPSKDIYFYHSSEQLIAAVPAEAPKMVRKHAKFS